MNSCLALSYVHLHMDVAVLVDQQELIYKLEYVYKRNIIHTDTHLYYVYIYVKTQYSIHMHLFNIYIYIYIYMRCIR